MNAIIEVKNLVKTYSDITAVNDISFSITEGLCFGLLGPNGAGKTTSIEIIEGITQPTSGEVYYMGHKIGQQFKQEAGIQFQHTSLQDFLTVRETLSLFQRLYEKSVDLDELIEDCALGEFIDRDNRKLSGGQRQRLLLAIALINDPKVVFLDEPTTGLDPQARRNFWRLIENIKARNKTIILTTHYMEEAAILCDEIIIMDKGVIVAQGMPDDLLKEHFDDILLLIPEEDFTVNDEQHRFKLSRHSGQVTIHSANVHETLRELNELNVSLARLEIRTRNLEDLFLELTGKELRS